MGVAADLEMFNRKIHGKYMENTRRRNVQGNPTNMILYVFTHIWVHFQRLTANSQTLKPPTIILTFFCFVLFFFLQIVLH